MVAVAGKGPTLADGAKHDCVEAGCYLPTGEMRWPCTPVHLKWYDVKRNDMGERMCDNITRVLAENTVAIGLLALDAKDMAALEKIVAATPGVKNYAVLIRRMIRREAKAL